MRFECGSACCVVDHVTVQQALQYTRLMQLMESQKKRRERVFVNIKIVQMFFGLHEHQVKDAQLLEVLAAAKGLHFLMQSVVLPKFAVLSDGTVEREASAFDEYDRENGYEDEAPDPWKIHEENIEAVARMAIRALNDSYSEVMRAELAPLLDHIAYQIRRMDKK